MQMPRTFHGVWAGDGGGALGAKGGERGSEKRVPLIGSLFEAGR
jgi:hypothetical protein